MGRATIISELGDGQYRIQPVIDTATAAAQIASLTAESSAIDGRLVVLADEIISETSDLDFITAALRAAITNKEPDDYIQGLQNDLNNSQNTLWGMTSSRERLKLKNVSNEKRIAFLQENIATPDTVDAWCADLTLGVSGVVGTIELGRMETPTIIVPGCAAHVDADDGRLQPVNLATPASVFYNYALITGAAKWRPRFRIGTASAVDTILDTMDVALDSLRINGVDCNQAVSLSGVPVEYMACNAEAFSAGDSVVVEFAGQDWAAPKVVGFVDNPQPCGGGFWVAITLDGNDLVVGGQQFAVKYTDTNGIERLTAFKSVGEVGRDNNVCIVPAENYSLAGPFLLSNWDNSIPAELVLSRDRDVQDTGIGNDVIASGSAYLGLYALHDCYEPDENGTYVKYKEENVTMKAEVDYDGWTYGHDFVYNRLAVITSGIREVTEFDGVSQHLVIPGSTTDWIETDLVNGATISGYNYRRYKFEDSGYYRRLQYIPVAEITAAAVAAAEASTHYTATDLTDGVEQELPLLSVSESPRLVCARVTAPLLNNRLEFPTYEDINILTNPTFLNSGSTCSSWTFGLGVTYDSINHLVSLPTGDCSMTGALITSGGNYLSRGGWYRFTVTVDSLSGDKSLAFESMPTILADNAPLSVGENTFDVFLRYDKADTLGFSFAGAGTVVLSGIDIAGLTEDYYATSDVTGKIKYQDTFFYDDGIPADLKAQADADVDAICLTTEGYLEENASSTIPGNPSDLEPQYVAHYWEEFTAGTPEGIIPAWRGRVASEHYEAAANCAFLSTVVNRVIVPESGSESFTDTGFEATCQHVVIQPDPYTYITNEMITYPATTTDRTLSVSVESLPAEFY